MNPTISSLLTLRLRQVKRILQDIGFVYLVLLSPLLFIAVLKAWEILVEIEWTYLPGLIVLVLFLMIHLNRKDGHFLPRLPISAFQACFSEYLLAWFPLAVIAGFAGNWQSPLVALIGIVFIAIIPPGLLKSSIKSRWSFQQIPPLAFEWRSGFRKHFIPIAFLYLAGLGLSYFTASLPLVAFFIATFLMTFHEKLEPKELMEIFFDKGSFLWVKIKLHSTVLHLFFLPLYLLFLVFHYPYWYVLVFIILFLQSIITFSIFYKYAHYRPKRKHVNASTPNAIFLMCALFPLTFPISLAMLLIYGQKAKNNLAQYYA